MKFKLFTFLKDNNLLVTIKEKIVEALKKTADKNKDKIVEKKEELKQVAENYIKDKTPQAKEIAVNFIMSNIKLGFPYNLFKGKIKKVIEKNIDKIAEFILAKIQEV